MRPLNLRALEPGAKTESRFVKISHDTPIRPLAEYMYTLVYGTWLCVLMSWSSQGKQVYGFKNVYVSDHSCFHDDSWSLTVKKGVVNMNKLDLRSLIDGVYMIDRKDFPDFVVYHAQVCRGENNEEKV